MALAPDPESRAPGLCCCPTLKLYASSSLDCTIRIWTIDNHLLRWVEPLRREGGRARQGAGDCPPSSPTSAPGRA